MFIKFMISHDGFLNSQSPNRLLNRTCALSVLLPFPNAFHLVGLSFLSNLIHEHFAKLVFIILPGVSRPSVA